MLFPMPSWDASHPWIVHFPIALLTVAFLFALAGFFLPKRGRAIRIFALSLMILGVIGAFVAVSAGEAAADAAHKTSQLSAEAEAAMHEHEEMGEAARTVFLALAILYAVMLLLPLVNKTGLYLAVHCGFLILYLAGVWYLANAAHRGGVLVHHYGIHAPLGAAAIPEIEPEDAEHEDESHESHEHRSPRLRTDDEPTTGPSA